MPQSPDIGQKLDEGISIFGISGQSITKVNCHNSRKSDDKLRPVTKTDKKSKKTSTSFDDAMSANCDVIVIFPNYDQFGAIRTPGTGCMVLKICILINCNFLSYKNWKQD